MPDDAGAGHPRHDGGTYNAQFGGGSYSIANLDISQLVGTNGDADLQAIISAVDKAIGK